MLTLKQLNANFKILRAPLETDKRSCVIDYNWVVDGILKCSTPYESHKQPNVEGKPAD